MINIHIFIINVFLNFWLCTLVNPTYDNATYITYTLHRPVLVFVWTVSTLFGLFFYAKKIWDNVSFPYSKPAMIISCCAFLGGFFAPYSNKVLWTNNLHVWLIALALVLYLIQWIRFLISPLPQQNRFKQLFLLNIFIIFSILFYYGQVNLIAEVYFSVSMNILLGLKAQKKGLV
ncbi:MAG: hypothetical protein J6D18_00335 [Erysipelotrichaceae bacterium]|nr:hypothetical protein [Erysipelotrichaceae bacterium]